ncbi:MAG: RNA polymerase sigma factor [Alphaproteobacteria bacterium]|nr:MAG: RNA polymerase sigma factor [Alphaproteobacteria bacterium]
MQKQAPTGHVTEEADDDAGLMRRIAAGDERAFRGLMQRHLARTVRLAARVMGGTAAAEDVAQEAFIRVWKHAGDWLEPHQAGAKFTTWLYRIVLNLCIDEKRKHRFSDIEAIPEPMDQGDDAQTAIERREQSERVRGALDELPDRQRAAFVLCFYEEHSNKEAAEILGISVKALESLLVRSRRALKDKLGAERQP